MITIIPALEIMKAVVDNNIKSAAGKKRRTCFDEATDLKSLGDVGVVLDNKVYKTIEPRLLDVHKNLITGIFRIDTSTQNMQGYDCYQSINFLTEVESKVNKVIVITENVSRYKRHNDNIVIINSETFLKKI